MVCNVLYVVYGLVCYVMFCYVVLCYVMYVRTYVHTYVCMYTYALVCPICRDFWVFLHDSACLWDCICKVCADALYSRKDCLLTALFNRKVLGFPPNE
jgi:hypothetical protein